MEAAIRFRGSACCIIQHIAAALRSKLYRRLNPLRYKHTSLLLCKINMTYTKRITTRCFKKFSKAQFAKDFYSYMSLSFIILISFSFMKTSYTSTDSAKFLSVGYKLIRFVLLPSFFYVICTYFNLLKPSGCFTYNHWMFIFGILAKICENLPIWVKFGQE
jgi:hypothetical protein